MDCEADEANSSKGKKSKLRDVLLKEKPVFDPSN
jgi:hypothetical protein